MPARERRRCRARLLSQQPTWFTWIILNGRATIRPRSPFMGRGRRTTPAGWPLRAPVGGWIMPTGSFHIRHVAALVSHPGRVEMVAKPCGMIPRKVPSSSWRSQPSAHGWSSRPPSWRSDHQDHDEVVPGQTVAAPFAHGSDERCGEYTPPYSARSERQSSRRIADVVGSSSPTVAHHLPHGRRLAVARSAR